MAMKRAPVFISRGTFLCLTLLTFIFVVPRLTSTGSNIVTNTYAFGSEQFYSGGNSYHYPIPGGDRFEYSPFFAMFFGLFSMLPANLETLFWALFNSLCFWLGISLWLGSGIKVTRWLVAGCVLAAMELNISLLYQQINAALVGLIFAALWLWKEEKYFLSGVLFAIVSNVKIFPALPALLLLIRFKKGYFSGLTFGALLVLILPSFVIGFSENIQMHVNWFHQLQVTAGDARGNHLNLLNILSRVKLAPIGHLLQGVVFLVTLLVSYLVFVKGKNFPLVLWGTFVMTSILLISPATESPTFVILAPAYVFLLQEETVTQNRSRLLLFCFSAFFLTFIFTDLWPRRILFDSHYTYKTLGASALWCLHLGWMRS
jgi:hypothetical protein